MHANPQLSHGPDPPRLRGLRKAAMASRSEGRMKWPFGLLISEHTCASDRKDGRVGRCTHKAPAPARFQSKGMAAGGIAGEAMGRADGGGCKGNQGLRMGLGGKVEGWSVSRISEGAREALDHGHRAVYHGRD
eukprot:scaffold34587_cov90-Isochrysis_galbana.AAC.2